MKKLKKLKKILITHSESQASKLIAEQLKKNLNWELKEAPLLNDFEDVLENKDFDIILSGGEYAYSHGSKHYNNLMKSHEVPPIIYIIDDMYKFDKIRREFFGDPEILISPFYLIDLIEKINRSIEKQENPKGKYYVLGNYNYFPSSKSLIQINNKSNLVKLTDKESAILGHLCKFKNETVTRDVLLEAVLGYNDDVTTHTIETHIYRIRQKIEKNLPNSSILITEAGGYRIKI